MSGARITHLSRRGAVYTVRFRLPADLALALGVAEIRKSLHTKDFDEARRRSRAATLWFAETVERLRDMAEVTRGDLERAARVYFEELTGAVDVPRRMIRSELKREVPYSIHLSHERVGELEDDAARSIAASEKFSVEVGSAEPPRDAVQAAGRLLDSLRAAREQIFKDLRR